MFLSETWIKENDAFDFNISGYTCEHLNAHKHVTQRKGRHSGGITVYYKDNLKGKVSVVEKSKYGFICIKLESELFKHGQNVFICSLYTLHIETIITFTSRLTISKYWKHLYPNMNVLVNYTSREISTHVLAIPKMKTDSNETITCRKLNTNISMYKQE